MKKGKLVLGTESQLSRIPRGFEALKGGPLDGPIRLKSFIVEEALADKEIIRPTLVGRIVDFAARAQPLLKFGWDAIG